MSPRALYESHCPIFIDKVAGGGSTLVSHSVPEVIVSVCLLTFVVLGMAARSLLILGKWSITKLHSHPHRL